MSNIESQENSSQAITKVLNETIDFRHQSMLASVVDYMNRALEGSITERSRYYNELKKIRENYIVNGIYDIIANDVFVDSGNNRFVSVEVADNKALEDELNSLFEKLNIPDLLISIFPSILHYGAHPLRPVFNGTEGLVALLDDYEPHQVLCVTKANNLPLFYFISENKEYQNGFIDYTKRQRFRYASISEVVYFTLDLEHIKLEIPDVVYRQIKTKVPPELSPLVNQNFKIKQSRSFIWGAIDKIKETLLLEKISVYKNMAAALSPTLVGIPVPDAYDPDKLIKLVKKYDELINGGTAKLNSLDNPEFTLQDIANVKVIPVAGERAIPQPLDTGRSERVIPQETLDRSLSQVLNTLGIPVEIFMGVGDQKENLKKNIRYAKKIKRIQKNICKSLKALCLLHISRKYPDLDISADDINIQLKNNVNIDELENLESQDLLISSVNSIKGLFEELDPIVQNSTYKMDKDEFLDKVKDALSSIGSQYSSVLVRKSANTDDSETDNEGKTDVFSTPIEPQETQSSE